VKHQITIADFLILNKTDQADNETIEAVKKEVHAINALAQIFETSYCSVDPDVFYNNWSINNHRDSDKIAMERNCGRPSINVAVFKTSRKIDIESLKEIINKHIFYTQRIKGYVLLDNNTIASIQTVYDHVDIKIIPDKNVNTALILMGEGFNLSEFRRDFQQFT
jgi:G3E family GTPase